MTPECLTENRFEGAEREREQAASSGGTASAALDQYYTREDVAEDLYRIFREHVNPRIYQMVEPSAGKGAFLRLLPEGSIGYDKDPRYPGILEADFLTTAINCRWAVAFIGNPPFGRNSHLALKFFNRAAQRASAIGFILPRTFNKVWAQNKLDLRFHLVRNVDVAENAFTFEGKPFHAPSVFQIWVRRRTPRDKQPQETTHPDFEFVTPGQANFAIQRIGTRAGLVHNNLEAGESSNYFIKGPVEHIMRQLDFASVCKNVAGYPSLAKSEIVSLYRAWKAQKA